MKRKNPSPLEIEIRRRVEAKYEERTGLFTHLASYVGVNALVWVIWLFTTGGFPWPVFVSFFWGIGMVGHLLDYYHKHGGGAQKREERIDEEVQRHLQRLEFRARDIYDEEALEGAMVYDLDDVEPRRLRLSADGELVDLDNQDEQKSPRRRAGSQPNAPR